MSDALHAWLSSYLINIGEEYGGSLTSAPQYVKRKKVQLVEYLTRGEGDDRIWVKVSDKQYRMPVCFTKLALEEFGRLNHSRLTSHKTALITIKDFRLVITRIPIGRGRKGMTAEPYLAFECDSFTIIGSIDEAEWGKPKEIHEERSIHEWIQGLRSHGGAGNVLKERKKAREERETVKESNQPPLLQQVKIRVTKQTARKTAPSPAKRARTNDNDMSPMTEHRRSWKYVENKIADIVTLHIPSPDRRESTSSEEPQPSTSRNAHTPQPDLPSPKIYAASPVAKASSVERRDPVSPFSSPLTEWSSTPSPRPKSRSIPTKSHSPSPRRDSDDKIITVGGELEQREPRIHSLPSSPAIIPATHELPDDDDDDDEEGEPGSESETHNSLFSDSDSDVDVGEQRDEVDGIPPPRNAHAASTSLTEDDSADAGLPLVRAVSVGVDAKTREPPPPLPSSPPPPPPPPPIASPLEITAMDVDEESPIILEYVDEPILTPPPSPKRPSERLQLPSASSEIGDKSVQQKGNQDAVDAPPQSLVSKHVHDPKEWLEPSYMRPKKRKLAEEISAISVTQEKPLTNAAPSPSTLPKPSVSGPEPATEESNTRRRQKTDAHRDIVKVEGATQTLEPLTKLKGFELDIPKAIRADERSKWCSWERLHHILLVTRRSRSPQ
ncbi:hypothetical protein EYR40_006639 [Pleurotus pulmonarius]|nr:hypothetical protein EYR40_006639 [Pleurotus pulmonarius]